MYKKVFIEKSDFPIITEQEFDEMQKQADYCIQTMDEERLAKNIDDYFESIWTDDDASFIHNYKKAKRIAVYRTDPFHIRPDWVKEHICERAYNDYYMEDTDQICGLELVNEFCENFNKQQCWYTSGDQVAWLDLSEQVKQFLMEEYDLTEKDWKKKEKNCRKHN